MLYLCSRLALLLILCGLVACSTSTPETPDPPAEQDLSALVVGEAGSSFLDALTERARMVQDDGSQKVTDYNLIVFDGDTHTPAALAEHPRLAEAMNEGAWVLVADATEAHKQEGVQPHVGFATEGDTDALLFRSVPGDLPVFDIMELPPVSVVGFENLEDVPDSATAEAQATLHRTFIDKLVAKVGAGTTSQQSGGCASPLSIQAGILYATWCYTDTGGWDAARVYNTPDGTGGVVNAGETIDGHVVQAQHGANDATFTFTLLLNNENVVTGNSQSLHVAVNGQMTPTTTVWPAGINDYFTGQPYLMGGWIDRKYGTDDGTESNISVAFTQSKLDINLGPDTSAGGVLKPASIFAPQTPNQSQTDSYTSSTSFTVGANLGASATPKGPNAGGGVSGSYTVSSSNTQSRTITDWTWTANLTGNNNVGYDWTFYSQSPMVGSSEPGGTWSMDWANRNALNDSLMEYGTEAVWTTESLSSETVKFDFGAIQQIASLNIYSKDQQEVCVNGICDIIPGTGPEMRVVDTQPQGIGGSASIDLSTVIPVTLEPASLTFSDSAGNAITQDNPVSAGENVTATVNLTGPAPFSYSITSLATSRNNNAVITESPVRITKGDTSKTFTLETNENGLDDGDKVAVDVFLGSFGSTAAQQLWITND